MEKKNKLIAWNDFVALLENVISLETRGLQQHLVKYDITPNQYELLQHINFYKQDGISINQLKSISKNKLPDISRMVDRLILKSLAKKEKSKIDNRLSIIYPSIDGIKLFETIQSELIDENHKIEIFGKKKLKKTMTYLKDYLDHY